MKLPKWKPLRRATPGRAPPAVIAEVMRTRSLDAVAAESFLDQYAAKAEYWLNDIYQVQVRKDLRHNTAHINIRRRDGGPILRDWRHFQQIKNEILGPECEAVELYPAESRKVDTSNKYHLWGFLDPSMRFPMGFDDRDVRYADDGDAPGLRQRELTMEFPDPADPAQRYT